MKQAETPQLLLVHDGELSDVRGLIAALGLRCAERLGVLRPDDAETDWDLVLGTPPRLLAARLRHGTRNPAMIALLDQDSRTLRNSLARAGIRLAVRRPVHPAALRALILHAIYRGPEKRRFPRVSVGAPVKVRVGWRARSAILADLSIGGCRIFTSTPLERGDAFKLRLPATPSGEGGGSVVASVLDVAPARNGERGERIITARFDAVRGRELERLRATVQHYTSGPERFAGGVDIEVRPPSAPERRVEGRVPFEERVVALDEQAAKVLMGRDLSIGGMRVDANPNLAVGMDVELAVHVDELERPLVLRAKVHRDDGAEGFLLRFHELESQAQHYLNELMDRLPLLCDSDEGGSLVTEILATA